MNRKKFASRYAKRLGGHAVAGKVYDEVLAGVEASVVAHLREHLERSIERCPIRKEREQLIARLTLLITKGAINIALKGTVQNRSGEGVSLFGLPWILREIAARPEPKRSLDHLPSYRRHVVTCADHLYRDMGRSATVFPELGLKDAEPPEEPAEAATVAAPPRDRMN